MLLLLAEYTNVSVANDNSIYIYSYWLTAPAHIRVIIAYCIIEPYKTNRIAVQLQLSTAE